MVGRGLADSEAFTRSSVLTVVGAVTFVAFGLLLPLTGFEIPALVLCVIWLKFLGGESWRNTIVISVVTVTVVLLPVPLRAANSVAPLDLILKRLETMDFNAFLDGFALVVEPKNLLYCLVGVLIGMVIGVLPGLGPAATIAILLPDHLHHRPGVGDHHARRHLLRRPVRRHHHLGAAAPAR